MNDEGELQGDHGQLYMAVLFWYPGKRDLSSVRYCTVAYTSVLFQHGHVYLVGLYITQVSETFVLFLIAHAH